MNPGGVYGPGGVGATGEPIVAALNGKLPMILPGVLNFVYVEDVAKGHVLAADKGRIGERYILSGGYSNVADLLRKACQLAGVKPPVVGSFVVAKLVANLGEFAARVTKRPPVLAKDVVLMLAQGSQLDGSKAERELGLHYTSLEEGLPKTLAWYWEQGLLKQKPKFLAQISL